MKLIYRNAQRLPWRTSPKDFNYFTFIRGFPGLLAAATRDCYRDVIQSRSFTGENAVVVSDVVDVRGIRIERLSNAEYHYVRIAIERSSPLWRGYSNGIISKEMHASRNPVGTCQSNKYQKVIGTALFHFANLSPYARGHVALITENVFKHDIL